MAFIVCTVRAYRPRIPGPHHRPPQQPTDDELLAMVRDGEVSMMAYATLLEGSLVREDRPLDRNYRSPANEQRVRILRQVAEQAGVTRTQLALAWLLHGDPAIVPVVGVSSVAQLDDCLAAVDVPRDAVEALARALAEAGLQQS